MTREEAIRKLQKQKAEYLEEWVDFSGVAEAYDMAIEALSAEAAQPEYYDYSDIDPLWNSFAEENDINLTDGAKQLKDAMWVGYRKGKQGAQPEIIRCKDCKHWRPGELCGIWDYYISNSDFYCGCAERREEWAD